MKKLNFQTLMSTNGGISERQCMLLGMLAAGACGFGFFGQAFTIAAGAVAAGC